MGKKFLSLLDFLFLTFGNIKENMEELKIDSELGSKDLDEILKNPADRDKFEKALEQLKNSKTKTTSVKFSDRELEISID